MILRIPRLITNHKPILSKNSTKSLFASICAYHTYSFRSTILRMGDAISLIVGSFLHSLDAFKFNFFFYKDVMGWRILL
jgi:hypothetical protein